MSEVEHKPVDVPAAEPAPAEETTAIDTVSTHSASANPPAREDCNVWEGY